MPVSHLGLFVSHIPSATSFYLSALHPLGYHYVGQRGDSIGLGVTDADLYLTQDTRGTPLTPTHIAFRANSRLAVRNCYAAALNAGGRPSGAPAYIDPEGIAFNAAVEDLDGNTIEFIFQEPHSAQEELPAVSQKSESGFDSARHGDGDQDSSQDGRESLTSRSTRGRSRAPTALQAASATSMSRRQSHTPASTQAPPPSQGISRASTLPANAPKSEFPSKKIIGTILGAAAGAALAFAVTRSESENAREERDFTNSSRSQSVSRGSEMRPRRELSEPPRSRYTHRNYSVTESFRSIRYPPAPTTRTIEAGANEDDEILEAISRYQASSRRPGPRRSLTYDAIEYVPARSTTEHGGRHTSARVSAMPADGHVNDLDTLRRPRSRSHASRPSTHHSSRSEHSPKRRDSVVSTHSHRSHRSHRSTASRHSTHVSTVKPRPTSSRHDSAAGVPLPASRPPSSYVPPLNVAPPASYVSAARVALPRSRAGAVDDEEDSDGLGDCKTVVPDDSISCVDVDTRSRRHHGAPSHRSSGQRSSRHSEADSERTVRPEKPGGPGDRRSAFTLPVRAREDDFEPRRGRKTYSYA